MPDPVRLSTTGPLARITIDHPPLNVITTAMLVELDRVFGRAADDPAIRLIRLDAEGKLFSAGVDVADHVEDRVAPMMRALVRLFDRLDAIELPIVSVVHGAALGGGSELVLATDLCFASDRATFGQPEVRLGLFAPAASVLLPRLVGQRRALGMLLSGETISAVEAERFGIVNEVFPHGRLQQEVATRLDRLLELSGSALRQAKHAVRVARGLSVPEAHRRLERLYLEELMQTTDANEGLKAFLEKRRSVWTHR